MGYKRKYQQGRAVVNLQDFASLVAQRKYFYWPSSPTRPKHHSVIVNMAYLCVKNAIDSGRLMVAERVTDVPSRGNHEN